MSNTFVIIHILGAVQGGFLAAVLMSRRHGSIPNRLLALTMLAFAVDLASAVFNATGVDAQYPVLIGLDYPLAFVYGPLLFLYAKTLSQKDRHFKQEYFWHFLPFGIVVLYMLPFYLQSGTEKLSFLQVDSSGLRAQVLDVVNHVKLIHALCYVSGTLSLLRRHGRTIRESFSYTEHINLAWLRNIMLSLTIMTGFAVVLYLAGLGNEAPVLGLNPDSIYDDLTLLGLAVFVYGIGFMGLQQSEVFDSRWEQPPSTETRAEGQTTSAKYEKSGMDPALAVRYKNALLSLMDSEQLYRQGDLTLLDLSSALSISPHNLTEVINTQVGQNFYDFVNGYRVDEAKKRLANPDYDHLTILAIASDSGFNSKSSFNALFKKHTGLTPSQFKISTSARASNPSTID